MDTKLLRQLFPESELSLQRTDLSKHGAPVSFTASTTSGVTLQGQNLNASALQSGYRGAYLIDEIRIVMRTDEIATADATLYGALGYLVSVQFQIGQHRLMKTPVPVGILSPDWVGGGTGELLQRETAAGATDYFYFYEMRWPLPKPLYLAPGDGIQAYVQSTNIPLPASHTGSADIIANLGASVNLSVTYIGRTLPPGFKTPETRAVPWVSAYTFGAYTDSVSAVPIAAHTNDEFRNPFTVPLLTQRFTSRPYLLSVSGNNYYQAQLASEVTVIGNTVNTYTQQEVITALNRIGMKVDDSLGYKMVQGVGSSLIPFPDVFDQQRYEWVFSRPLGPREQYNMQFQTSPISASDDRVDLVIGMIGSREEAI